MDRGHIDPPRAFTGGRILTMDPAVARAEVVVIENGRIAAVGERDLLRAYPGITVENLAGRTLLPGFIDAHNHLSIAALHPIWAAPGLVKMRARIVSAGIRRLPLTSISETTSVCAQLRDAASISSDAKQTRHKRQHPANEGDGDAAVRTTQPRLGTTRFSG